MLLYTYWSLWFICYSSPGIFFTQIKTAETRKGVCYAGAGGGVCCANYRLVGGKCIECPNGTYRIEGETCTVCLEEFFGRFCSSTCPDKCNKCHPVDGSCCTDNGNGCQCGQKSTPRRGMQGGVKCCADYYKEDGKCIECKLGYYRFKEDNERYCKPSEVGFYGKRCKEKCTCSNIERCHNVEGCVCKTTDSRSGNCTYQDNTSEIPIHQLLQYGLPPALSAFLIIIVALIIKRKVKCTVALRGRHQKESIDTLDMSDEYEMIDESLIASNGDISHLSQQTPAEVSNISDDIVPNTDMKGTDYLQPISENEAVFNDSDDSVGNGVQLMCSNEEQEVPNDGYLHPYQPLQKDWLQNTHVYNTAKKSESLHDKSGTNLNLDKQNDKQSKMLRKKEDKDITTA